MLIKHEHSKGVENYAHSPKHPRYKKKKDKIIAEDCCDTSVQSFQLKRKHILFNYLLFSF